MAISKTLRFMRDVRSEAHKISWPGLKQTRTMTIMVFVLVVIIAIFLVLVDMGIGSALNFLLSL